MKRTKRVVMSIMVLCLVLIGLLTPERIYAASDSDFVIENGVLTKYHGSGGNVVIPDGVTEIGSGAFSNCRSLTSVKIPDSITEIGSWAFGACTSLTSVTIPDSVTKIGETAFGGCSKLKEFTIPSSVTKIEESAFRGCSSLTNVTIPSSVTSIECSAFDGCINLTSITIPDSVTAIDTYAFRRCSKLKEFTIPENVTKLGFAILNDCDSLEKITILNKKVNLIDTYPSELFTNVDFLSTILGITEYGDGFLEIKKPTKTITIYGYKYSSADEFVTRLNTLQAASKAFGIKSLKFVSLDKSKNTLDKIKVPKSITITKGKSKKLSIQLPSSLKRVNEFTKNQGQVNISITYSKETFKYSFFLYDTKNVSNDTIKATEKGTGYAYTTVTLPNGDKKVFATKVIVK